MAEVTALELPTFKGRPGWEFTDLSRLDLSAFAAPEGGDARRRCPRACSRFDGTRLDQVDGAVSEGTAVEDGPVVLPLSVARERHPELVEPHLGRVVARRRRLHALERGRLGRRRVRLGPARRARRGADPPDRRHRRGRHRAAAARADRARGGRRGRGLGAVPVRRRRVRDAAQHRRRARRGPERPPALRLRAGPQREVVDLRRPARRGGPRRLARLGRRRLRRRQRPRAHRDAAGRRGRPGQGHRRLRAARPPARRLRHHAGARRAEHDVRPRLPRHPRRPLAGGLARR